MARMVDVRVDSSRRIQCNAAFEILLPSQYAVSRKEGKNGGLHFIPSRGYDALFSLEIPTIDDPELGLFGSV